MENYNLEIEKAIEKIKQSNSKKVLIQLPDGLKPKANKIVSKIISSVKEVKVDIWSGSCFGACDTPVGIENLKPQIDLVIQFGHNEILPQY